MNRGIHQLVRLFAGGLAAACMVIVIAVGGCASNPPTIATGVDSNLLLGDPWEDGLARHLGRSDWPATWNGYHSPQETVYIEYYRDFFGNEFQERQTPQRNFRSYSVGAAQRPSRP
jgi:hypothetical protein